MIHSLHILYADKNIGKNNVTLISIQLIIKPVLFTFQILYKLNSLLIYSLLLLQHCKSSYCSLKKVFTVRCVWLFSRSYKLLILKITCTSYQARTPDGCALLPQIPQYYRLFAFGKNILAFVFRKIHFLKKLDLFLRYNLIYSIDSYLFNLLLQKILLHLLPISINFKFYQYLASIT